MNTMTTKIIFTLTFFLLLNTGDIALSQVKITTKKVNERLKNWWAKNGSVQRGEGTGQEGGYMVGPNLRVTVPVEDIRPVQIDYTLPSFSAGCGGIDFATGGIEGIKLGNFQKSIEAIGTNIPGVALMLGMQVLSPQLTSVVKEFKGYADKINEFGMNSCTAATNIVKGTASAMMGMELDCIAEYRKDNPNVDFAGAKEYCSEKKGGIGMKPKTNATPDEPEFRDGNLVWYLLSKSGRYTPDDTAVMEIMMNLMGTVIMRPAIGPTNQGASPNGVGVPRRIPSKVVASPTIFVKQLTDAFLDGTQHAFIISGCKSNTTTKNNNTNKEELDKFGCKDIDDSKMIRVVGADTKKDIENRMIKIIDNIYNDVPYADWADSERSLVNDSKVPVYRFLVALAGYLPKSIAIQDNLLSQYAGAYSRVIFLTSILDLANEIDQIGSKLSVINNGEEMESFRNEYRDAVRILSDLIREENRTIASFTEMAERTSQYEKILATRVSSGLLESALWGGR